jgi:hypothetical protein
MLINIKNKIVPCSLKKIKDSFVLVKKCENNGKNKNFEQ